MGSRLDLQILLLTICDNVYFQPPPDMSISYPCIVYARNDIDTAYADNLPYALTKQYRLTVIDKDPDSDIPETVAKLPGCSFDRAYKTEQMNHDVFTIHF